MRRRVAIFLAAALAFVAIALAQVPGQGLFYLGGEDPWWRPLNPQGQSYGITVGAARPSPPMNGEIFLDMDGAVDGGPKLEIYDGTNDEWDGVSIAELSLLDDVTITSAAAGDILMHNGTAWVDATTLTGNYTLSGTNLMTGTFDISTLTDNTIPAHDDATGNLIDSSITDDATTISFGGTTVDFAASGLFNMSADGSATATAITLGASSTADAQIYFDGDSLVIDTDGTTTNDIDLIVGATGDITLTTNQLDILSSNPYVGVQDDVTFQIGDVSDASSEIFSAYYRLTTNSAGSDGTGGIEMAGQAGSNRAIDFIVQSDTAIPTANMINFTDQSPAMDGSDSTVFISVAAANANATGSSNTATVMQFDSITPDAEKIVTVIDIQSGYDVGISNNGREVYVPQAESCADEATGAQQSLTLTPVSAFIVITQSDTQGCDITMSETGAISGQVVYIQITTAAGDADFADTDGVQNLTGALALGDDDTLTLVYATDEWVEVATSNN